jgi:hypothetical protein
MILAKGPRPRSALSRLALILLAAGPIAGCQSAPQPAPPTVVAADDHGWQVIERLGDARYRTSTDGWSPAMPPGTLPDGSRVATGTGGRLILARPGEHIAAGPASRFSLPDAGPGAPLEQRAGQLRYRIAGSPSGGLRVVTPFLEIEAAGTVADVTVGSAATEIAVQAGRVRIATPDGLRQIELGAGQSAYAAGTAGDSLAFRRTAGAPLESVEATVLRAMQPRPGVRESRAAVPARSADYAGSRASTSGAAASEAAVPIAKAEAVAIVPAAVSERRAPPTPPPSAGGAAVTDERALGAQPAPLPSLDDAGNRPPPLSEAARNAVARPEPAERAAEKLQPTAFDRLSEGMVQGVPGALSVRHPTVDAQRSF